MKPKENMKAKIKFCAADIAECAIFVVLMTLSAYIQIPFPLVPLTFQTAISILAGLLLGWKKGLISMAVYCFSGLVGLPVFAAGGGITYVLKPSFGYIIGFMASAFFAGLFVGKSSSTKNCFLGAIVGFLANYMVGIPYCIVAAYLLQTKDLVGLFITGNLIYMPKDLVLACLAALLARTVLPAIEKHRKKTK